MNARFGRLLPVLLLLLLSAPPAAADSATDALRQRIEAQRRSEAEEEARRGEWQQRERDRVSAIEGARRSLAEAQANRVRAQDGAYDGIKRSEWTRRVKEAEKSLAEAEHQLDEFLEEARQNDVPPGWLESND